MNDRQQNPAAVSVLVYSSNAAVRAQVIAALGTTLHPDLPPLEHLEVATAPTVFSRLDAGGVDLVVLDGEATPTGGMGIAKQIDDEYDPAPPVLLLVARADDAWLASWSRADAVVSRPIDPFALAAAALELLAPRVARR